MMNIRFAQESDIPGLAEIEHRQPRCAQWGKIGWKTELAQSASYVFCAVDDKCVLGFVALRAVAESGEILNVGVHPNCVRQGVGETVLVYALNWAQENHVKHLSLEVAETNLPAVRLYEKLGFTTVGRRKNFYAENEDGLILVCNL